MLAPVSSQAVLIHGCPPASFLKVMRAEPARLHRIPRIIEIDGIRCARLQSVSGKSTNTAPESRSYFSGAVAQQNFVDVQCRVQIELNSRRIRQHLEADRILPAEILLLRIDANIQVIRKQIVVSPISAILAAQKIRMRRHRRGIRRLVRRNVLSTLPRARIRARHEYKDCRGQTKSHRTNEIRHGAPYITPPWGHRGAIRQSFVAPSMRRFLEMFSALQDLRPTCERREDDYSL